QSRVEGFAEDLVQTMNRAGLALMLSLGHRTGLFDTMAGLPPSPAAEIAVAAGLSERYVRERLGAMVGRGGVEHGGHAGTYHLPAEHAACLTRTATPNNLAAAAQWVAVLGAVENQVVEAFGHGKGVSYNGQPRFHEVMAEESRQTTVWGLVEHILPLV